MRRYQVTYSFPAMDGERRLRELILYISHRCASDPGFGLTKLNKILHRGDLRAFAKRGTPLTGVEYQALEAGPAPRRLLPVKNEMRRMGEIDEVERKVGERTQVRIVPRRSADMSMFSPEEVADVEEAISALWGKSGILVSRESHGLAWFIAKKADSLIPYEAAFLSNEEVARPEDVARARVLAQELGWNWGRG